MASRFWKAQPASAIADNGSGKCRVTVASTTGMTSGDTRLFFGFTGTTGLNGSQTITVISGTTLDVSAVNFVATGTGSINGLWNATNANNWVSSSGGTDYGQTVPGSADTVTLDSLSGGGTVTLNFGGTITIQSITCGTFTGTFDNSVNNNNITLTANTGFNGSGSGTRTIKLGTATYTLSATAASWTFGNITNLTFTGNTGCSIVFTGSTGTRSLNGGLSYGNVTFGASSGAGIITINGANTFASLSITAPNYVTFPISTTTTISGAFTWAGSSGAQIGIVASGAGSTATIAAAASSTASWAAFRDMIFTGAPTASNSFDLLNNSGIAITAPSVGGGGGVGVIGS